MRKEKITIDSFAHIYNRGNRKQPIVCDSKDKWHFLEMLYYFNDEFTLMNPFRDVQKLFKTGPNKPFIRPLTWPERKPLVKIMAFSLLENHFHLFLKEIREGGITKFMRRLGTGMATYFNEKYQETGRLFQGPYKSKLINEEIYFKYLSVYIQVKNVFELYPGGLNEAIRNFDKAYEWAIKYPYSSLGDYAGERNSPIIDKDILGELFSGPEEYKEFSEQCLTRIELSNKLGKLTLED
ncbi:MAG: transposase [Candidatus Pacebacteria bacterium]|nr:transposase [Candidatus Paceibacterota bacterium]